MKTLASKLFQTTKSKIIAIIIAAAIILGLCSIPFIYDGSEKVDVAHMSSLLTKASELTTAKLTITGMASIQIQVLQ